MKKKIIISVNTIETREIRYIKEAERAIQVLENLVTEMELGEPGRNLAANREVSEPGEKETLFHVLKTIDTEEIKEPLDKVEKLVKQLHIEVNKLKSAIITELTKEKPQE